MARSVAAPMPETADSIPLSMTALIKPSAGPGAELAEVPVPTIGERDVLVRVDATSICGTDLHIYTWDEWAAGRMKPPIVFGHEFCGTVVRAGGEVSRVKLGDFVAAESHVVCGHCEECRAGELHACRNVEIIGVDRPGAFAQYVAIPEANAWPVSGLPPEIATLEEPLGNAVHTVSSTPIVGADVAIFGLGPLGLFALRIAKVYGAARVFGIEVSPFRARLGQAMGADRVLQPERDDIVGSLLEETGGEGVDVVLEMSGNQRAFAQALKALRYGGTMALLGLPSHALEVDVADGIIFKGATIKGIVGRRVPETWHQTRGLLENGVDMSPVVTETMPLGDFERAFALLGEGRTGKIIMYPNQTEKGISA
ncbi:MAG TPA: L-threonine 3-dehydrogenase [Chloroflexota bacterium]|nr:L-threonine 3-dehydrogenase [Chloroflexota bacterium]